MITQDTVQAMSLADKLDAMELIWADLSAQFDPADTPAWHEAALKATENVVQAGAEVPLNWADAKTLLRDQSSS